MVRHDLVVLWNNVLTWYYRGVECTEPIRKAHTFATLGRSTSSCMYHTSTN